MNYKKENIELIEKKRIPSAVVNATNEITITSSRISSELNLIDPILIGNKQSIINICKNIKWDLGESKIIDSPNEKRSSEIACKMASKNEVKLLVKGHMHTDVLMSEYIKNSYGLRNKGEKLMIDLQPKINGDFIRFSQFQSRPAGLVLDCGVTEY